MINIIKNLVDIKEPEDIKYGEVTEDNYNEYYKYTTTSINQIFKSFNENVKENMVMMRDFMWHKPLRVDNTQKYKFHSLVANPYIPPFDNKKLDGFITRVYADEPSLESHIDSLSLGLYNDKPDAYAKNLLGMVIETNMTEPVAVRAMDEAMSAITLIKDNAECVRDKILTQLPQCNTPYLFDLLYKAAYYIIRRESAKVYAIMIAFLEVYRSYIIQLTMIESSTGNEDVSKYVSELREMIPKCREFFDKFKYKEIITPRKKTINKMDEYMRGALERKYTLKIPLYKVEDASPEAKNIIENQFIKGLDRIVDKYPNYVLMTPDFKDDSDMFIYITLKEPFGDKPDRKDRENQSKNDGAVIEEAASTVAAIVAGSAVAIPTVAYVMSKIVKKIKSKKLSEDDKKFNEQKVKLTQASDFNYNYIKDMKNTISKAKFVKVKDGLQNIMSELIKNNTQIIKLSISAYKLGADEQDGYKKIYDEMVKVAVKSFKLLDDLGSDWVDVSDSMKSNLSANWATLYDQYVEIFSNVYEYPYINKAADDLWSIWNKVSQAIKIQLEGDTLTEAASYSQKDYDLINKKINTQTKRMNNLSSTIDAYIVKNGHESKDLQKKYEEMCGEMDGLVKERHIIARGLNESAMLEEAALTADDRKNIPDELYGLPGKRYPLNDDTHIRLAIAMMHPCSVDEKKDLARNIAKQVCKQKLVGKITVSETNPNSKYFPVWMIGDATLDSGYIHHNNKKYKVKDILEEATTGRTLEFYI